MRQGAPPEIRAIAQAKDGSLWIGSGEGLFRFDGFTFQPITAMNTGLPAPPEIFSLLALPDGSLWIGTGFDGIVLLQKDGGMQRFPSIPGMPAHTTVTGFVSDSQGRIWAGTAYGLATFNGASWQAVGPNWGVPARTAFLLKSEAGGTLWATAIGKGLYRLSAGEKRFQKVGTFAELNLFFDRAPQGEVWAGARNGICRIEESAAGLCRPHGALQKTLGNSKRLLFDRRGNLWVFASVQPGILRFSVDAFRARSGAMPAETGPESFRKRDGLTSDHPLCVFQDNQDGSIWVGTDNGLDHFREAPFLPVYPQPGTHAFGVQPDKNGNVWISDDSGQLWSGFPNGRAQLSVRAQTGAGIDAMFSDPGGGLVFAQGSQSLLRYEAGKITPVPTAALGPQISIQTVVADRQHRIWASFIPGGLERWDGRHWIKNGGFSGLPDDWVVILATDAEEGIWAGYLHGTVACVRRGSVTQLTAKNGLYVGAASAILPDRAGAWIAGVNGLVYFDGQRVRPIRDAGERKLGGITGIVRARNGDLWLNEWDGVRRIRSTDLERPQKDGAYIVHADYYDVGDGLPSAPLRFRPFPTAIAGADGRIWFALRSGVVSIAPLDSNLEYPAPPVTIVRVVADGREVNRAGKLELRARTKNLEIDYAAVSLNRSNRVRFRYKLDGIDSKYAYAGARRQALYSNLPPGTFTLHVQASNGDNLWSENQAALAITMPPAFTQTILFRALCGLAAFVGVWGLLQTRFKRMLATIQGRLKERARERERIACELHDTLLQGYLSASMHVHVALERSEPESLARPALSRALELMTKANAESRMALQGLRSTPLGDILIEQALANIPSEIAPGSSVKYRVNVQEKPRSLRLSIVDDLYRIGREAIVNAFQHADATQIEVTVRYASRQLQLKVRDNGCGMEDRLVKHGVPGHWGLKGLTERAVRIGAKLSVVSKVDEGTEIALAVPGQLAYELDEMETGHFARWRAFFSDFPVMLRTRIPRRL